MAGIDWYQNPNDPNGPITVTPQPGQIIRVKTATHQPGPSPDFDGVVEFKPRET